MNLSGQIFKTDATSVTIAAASSESGSKTPTFDMVAYTGAAIRQLFAEYPIVVDLEGMTIPDRSIPIRLQHSSSAGVGHADKVSIVNADGRLSLQASGIISRATEAARDVVESGKKGFPWQASIGAEIQSVEEVLEGTVEVNGQEFTAPILVARRTSLSEISFVDLGADDNTLASIAASQRAKAPKGTDEMNKDTDTGSDSKPIEASNTPSTDKPKTDSGSGVLGDLRAMGERAKVDAERNAKIKASAARVIEQRPDIADQVIELAETAISDKIDASDFSLQMLQMSRDYPGVGGPRADRADTGEMIEAGLCMELGIADSELVASYGERTVEAARKRFEGGLGINEAVTIAAQASGFDGRTVKSTNIGKALYAAFDPRVLIQAASTISLPNILSNVANKVSMSAFNAVESTWRQFADVASLNDFKEHQTNSLIGDYELKQLGASGDIEHAVPGEISYTNQVDTYARLLEVTRRDIVNDNTGALMEAPRKLGRGSGQALNKKIYAEFLDDASFFTGGRSNLLTGAGSALDVDSLTAAATAFLNQTDPDGESLGLGLGDMVLLVPPALAHTAKTLVNSSEIRGASGTYGTANPHQGGYEIAVSTYLTSATAWYIVAKPSVLPVIQVGFLNGQQSPTIETAQADFNHLGIKMRAWMDFGARKWEYRGGIKNDGA